MNSIIDTNVNQTCVILDACCLTLGVNEPSGLSENSFLNVSVSYDKISRCLFDRRSDRFQINSQALHTKQKAKAKAMSSHVALHMGSVLFRVKSEKNVAFTFAWLDHLT